MKISPLCWLMLLFVLPSTVQAGEACELLGPFEIGVSIDQMEKRCRPIPDYTQEQDLHKDVEKIGFVGDTFLVASRKLAKEAFYCRGVRGRKSLWLCSRPAGMSACGTQIQSVILDMIADNNRAQDKESASLTEMTVGGFRTRLTKNCEEELEHQNLDLPSRSNGGG